MIDTVSKNPVPDRLGRPKCYGYRFAPTRELCQPCKFKQLCAARTLACQERKSLSELAAAEANRVLAIDLEADFKTLYRKVYERVYGTRLFTNLDNPRNHRALEKAESFCIVEKIRPEIWISAQMTRMQPFLEQQRATPGARFTTFQPNMLNGKNASHRYNVYIQRMNRRTGGVSADGLMGSSAESALYALVGDIAVEETRLLWFLCEARIHNEQITLEEAAVKLETTQEWQYAVGLINTFQGLTQDQRWQLDKVKLAAVLQGAENTAALYHYRLPYRIGLNLPFDREAFACMIATLYPLKTPKHKPLSVKLGLVWPNRL